MRGIIGIDQTTGEKIFNEIPGRVNVSVTVSAIAKNKDPGYYVDGVIISCGGEYSFRTATVSLKGTCMTMSDQ